MDATRFPLSWPVGWPRTPRHKREKASFRTSRVEEAGRDANGVSIRRLNEKPVSVNDAIQRLRQQVRLLGVLEGDLIVSTNVQVRLDGMPYSNQREPEDPGVAVYFRLNKQDRVLACDRWTRLADNIAAIAQHIDAIRRIDRYGVGTLEQAFAGYVGLPAKGQTWRSTLGFPPDAAVTKDAIEQAFKARARQAHPDVQGGSHDAMASLTAAKREALEAIEAGA